MTPDEIIRDAEDMAANYPDDRLRLTGQEILDLIFSVRTRAIKDIGDAASQLLITVSAKAARRLDPASKSR